MHSPRLPATPNPLALQPKTKPAASAQPSRAATPAVGGTGKVTAGTGKVKAGTGKVQAAPSRSSTGKVVAGSAAKAAARPSTPARSSTPPPARGAVRPGTPSLKRAASATGKVKAGAAAMAASGSTVKTVVKQVCGFGGRRKWGLLYLGLERCVSQLV